MIIFTPFVTALKWLLSLFFTQDSKVLANAGKIAVGFNRRRRFAGIFNNRLAYQQPLFRKGGAS